MAMDALKNLSNNVPDWLQRLDDLSKQIIRRQAELAAVAAADPKAAEAKSMRNKGSTESLKPQDDGPSNIADPDVTSAPQPAQMQPPRRDVKTPPPGGQGRDAPAPEPGSVSPSTVQKQARDAVLAAHSRPRPTANKRHRSASLLSAEGATPTYRTRSMIIVYYDSYVQTFFDDLVRFVSTSRNLMRKAKMAAKVAQIKRMAEADASEEGNGSGDEKGETDALPSLRYMSTRRLGPMTVAGGKAEPPDVYDRLDKGLEFVQSTCEHGAHQFLRDADCNDEIKKIQQRLAEVLDMAKKEAERVEREEPELAKDTGDAGKIRTRRPISMRREPPTSKTDIRQATKEGQPTIEAEKPDVIEASDVLEADTNMGDADEGIEVDQLPKLQYRSTRNMRSRVV